MVTNYRGTTTSLAMMVLLFIIASLPNANAQSEFPVLTSSTVIYKPLTNTDSLLIEVIAQEDYLDGDAKNAMIFYFGGGWINGSIEYLRPQATYFASHGLVCFLVEYRTQESHQTPPIVSLMDAKSAIRYIKSNAEKFNIDADNLITSGGSAGGHLAAAVTLCPHINHSNDDMSISTTVQANVLFNPVVCNGAGISGADKGYGYERVAAYYKDFSPYYNVRAGVPATLFMVGSEDALIDTEVAYEYKRRIEAVGGRCDVHIYEGQAHSFFNPRPQKKNVVMFAKTMRDAHEFLFELGYIQSKCNIVEWIEKTYPDCIYE